MLPWPCDPRAPRGNRRAAGRHARQRRPAGACPRPASAASGPRPPSCWRSPLNRYDRRAPRRGEQLARARRVGRDLGVVNRSDYGHGIRLVPIRGPHGTILREADVEVVDAPDPDVPKVTLRRARRTDPLEVLKRGGTISAREREAGEKLRDAIERSQPSLPGVSRSEVHVAPWDRVAISERQLKACRSCARRWARSKCRSQWGCGSCALGRAYPGLCRPFVGMCAL